MGSDCPGGSGFPFGVVEALWNQVEGSDRTAPKVPDAAASLCLECRMVPFM